MKLYVNTDHTQNDEEYTQELIVRLENKGWDVVYGQGSSWDRSFEDDDERAQFESDWDDIVEEMRAEKEE